ncbi:MAG: Asp-tRNA(Asn)/Glu-tRNA(Gln) amidotransferase subunit GatB [Anaerolineae bacterium]|nr:MAG: Asp-tRNA(Asn)/Glu-tRNA(Gln) amidotransferase subunit GatB [Anaerolineae bacterium]
MEFEAIIGLEVHAEIATRSKMFCSCPVLDTTQAEPNQAVCPVCSGMPGTLPVVNRRAVELGLRVALALGCDIPPVSVFARKNYFYPDLPKGYQISQYRYPLAVNGVLEIAVDGERRPIRVRRVHLEEDTGKLTHMQDEHGAYSLVDLNRAGVPLLEIVSEPDMRSAAEARAYGEALRQILRYLQVNSGDMQKGVLRFEANVSLRPKGATGLGTRTEIKNLNSFRALERSIEYEIERQSALLRRGETVIQQTVGWDEAREITLVQRGKEEEDDYRYFPEPDLPPLVISAEWLASIRSALPELPHARQQRFEQAYGLRPYDAGVLTAEAEIADYFEAVVRAAADVPPRQVANWITGELFGLLNRQEGRITHIPLPADEFAHLLRFVQAGEINTAAAKRVLAEMLESGDPAAEIIARRGLRQISDADALAAWVDQVLNENPAEVQAYLDGKEGLLNWFFGQVMRLSKGKADPQVVRRVLEGRLQALKGE